VVNCGRWIDTHTVVVVRTCTRTVNCVPGNSSVVYSAQRRAVGYMHSAAARRGAVHASTVQYSTVLALLIVCWQSCHVISTLELRCRLQAA